MMIVMKEGATEEQIQAVVERVESVGCSAHVSKGELLTVIGAIGDRDQVTELGLEGAPGRRPPRADPEALQARLVAVPQGRAHGARDRRPQGRRRPLRADRRPLHGREPRPDARRRPRRRRRRRDDAARRRLQAAHLAVHLPGPGPGGPEAARRGQGRDRPADRHRADGRPRPRRRARGRRRDPGRRPQHAELHAARRDRPLGLSRCCSSAASRRRSRSC